MRLAAGAVLMMVMTGCVTPVGAEPMAERGGGHCDAAPAKVVVGKAKSKALGARAMRLSGATAIRWIGPDSMVTMDFREDRLNLHLDKSNKVVRVRCG
jgi:hypothetical protein